MDADGLSNAFNEFSSALAGADHIAQTHAKAVHKGEKEGFT